jgi:hypothetical protein
MKSSWVLSHVHMETVSTISGTICLLHQGVAMMSAVFAYFIHTEPSCALSWITLGMTGSTRKSHYTLSSCLSQPWLCGEEQVSQVDHLSLSTILHAVWAGTEKSFIYIAHEHNTHCINPWWWRQIKSPKCQTTTPHWHCWSAKKTTECSVKAYDLFFHSVKNSILWEPIQPT